MILTSVLALLVVACSGDDDDAAPEGSDEPTSSETTTAEPDGGNSPTEAADISEDFGMAEAGSGGSGTVVLGDETLEYDVIVCSEEEEGVFVLSGRGHDGDGTLFVAEVGVKTGFEATAEISRGSSSVSDEGDPHWTAEVLDYSFGSNGRVILSFDATFTDASGTEIDGSVDVNCGV